VTPAQLDPVLVIGAGLVGTSVGLALREQGIAVHLADTDPGHLSTAVARGAGEPSEPQDAALVVAAVPPERLGETLAAALQRWPHAVVTDVGSIKARPLAQLEASGADVSRYVGGHPMAGRERAGPEAASASLFAGRAWAVTPHPRSSATAVETVRRLAEMCGASVVELTPADHDAAVARVSHLPHLLAVLAAARLTEATGSQLALSGPGLRDVTRVAAGEPALWRAILLGNAAHLQPLLAAVRDDLDELLGALGSGDAARLESVLGRGRAGANLVPGKHGSRDTDLASILVEVPDRPGELARLFADAGRSGVNVEDLRIDHDPARPVGRVEVVVRGENAERLAAWLADAGWSVQRSRGEM